MDFQYPVIVVPGITASVLRDEYRPDPEPVWRVVEREYERIALHPDEPDEEAAAEPRVRYEGSGPARVRADRVFSIPYDELVRELRHNLTRRADEPTPVYPFAYDWRQPLKPIEDQLADFVDEVINRTKLMRHYFRGGYWEDPGVDLVGHSMGGLIIAGFLEAKGGEKVRKVATLATPFQGSFEAVIKVAVGTANLGPESSTSRERETARVTPALYHLAPSMEGAVEAEGGLSDDLFDPAAWQPGVVQTIVEYVRVYGLEREEGGAVEEVKKESWRQRAEKLFGKMLSQAHEHRERIDGLNLEDAGLAVDDWLCVVGVGETTRVTLKITEDDNGDPFFDLTSKHRKNGYLSPRERKELEERGEEVPDLWETGDGTVPYLGAKPKFLPLEKLVCVSGEEFGYWEIRDKLLNAGAGFHGILPKMNLAHKLVVAHLKAPKGEPGEAHDGLRGRRAPDLAKNVEWEPPLEGLQERKITED